MLSNFAALILYKTSVKLKAKTPKYFPIKNWIVCDTEYFLTFTNVDSISLFLAFIHMEVVKGD